MPLPTLESFDAMLDRTCVDLLGDAIEYAAYGTVFMPKRAHVDYRDASRSLDNAEVFEQDIVISIPKVDVPSKPGSGVRISLPKMAGKVFRPVNVRNDESGTHWEFELKQVANA